MYFDSAHSFRYLSISVLSIFFLFIFLFGYVNQNNSIVISAETTVYSEKMPNLSGNEAKEHLKKQGLYESLGEAMKAARYSIYPTKNAPLSKQMEALVAHNPRQGFSTYFTNEGIHLVSKAKNNKWRVQMNLKGYGYSDNIIKVKQTKAEVKKNKSRIEINKSAIRNSQFAITEWYENTSSGLEQGWTINEKQANANNEELKIVLELSGDLKGKLAADKQAIDFVRANDEKVLRYDKLKSWDVDGKELFSRMELKDTQLVIYVDDKSAKYPITIDPLFTQTTKLTASNAATGDEFGRSVSISGDTAIIGAWLSDDAGTSSGSAYIFERNSGGANIWGEVKKLTPSDAAPDDLFGYSVAISNDTAIVGARGIASGSDGGSAYIFERNSGGADMWGEVKKLTASDAVEFDQFGVSVSISGDTVIVGANGISDAGSSSGSAYIFERNSDGMGGTSPNNWGEVKKLLASDAAKFDAFGESVAISGDTAIIGAFGNDDDGVFSGSAYIFERNSGGANMWSEVKKLTASDAATNDRFGRNVSIFGDTVIIGVSLNDDAGTNSGSAYIFERNSGGAEMWSEVKKLTASDAAEFDQFGVSVSISDDTVIVGANVNDDDGDGSGSAYIFQRNMGGADMWGEVQKLTASDATTGDFFGISVSISGDTAIIGATGVDVETTPLHFGKTLKQDSLLSKSVKSNNLNLGEGNQGAAYVFEVPTSTISTVSGRVTTNTGQGVGNVIVFMSDKNGGIITATTNPFGYFTFRNVLAGKNYVLSARHKTYSFEPASQTIDVFEDITDISFTAITK